MGASTDFSAMHCSIARSFAAIGDPWKALILRDIHVGLTRFDQLVVDLGVSRKVLTQRLHEMVEDGLVERRPYQHNPPRFDYVLTERGRDLVPVMVAVLAWGDRWLSDEDGAPAIITHHDHLCSASVICEECGEELLASDVGALPGPGGAVGPGTNLIGGQMADDPMSAR